MFGKKETFRCMWTVQSRARAHWQMHKTDREQRKKKRNIFHEKGNREVVERETEIFRVSGKSSV